MIVLEARHQGDPRVAVRMPRLLVGKTTKQIREKRRSPVYQRKRDEYLAANSPESEGAEL